MQKYSETLRGYFATATSARKFAFLDLTPTLQRAARNLGGRELLYYPTTVHWTVKGHEVVAEAIRNYLKANWQSQP